MTWARRKDSNHNTIKDVFLKMGCTVVDLFRLSEDNPDLLVGCAGVDQLVEVKSIHGELFDGQSDMHTEWRGAVPIVARTVEDAVNIVADMGERGKKLRA